MPSRAIVSSVVGAAVVVPAIIVVGALVTVQAAAGVSRQEADSLSRKISLIVQQGTDVQGGAQSRPRSSTAARRTPLSEAELNSWFTYKAPAYLPAGVTSPSVTIVGNNGEMKGGAIVDLDAMAKTRRGGMLDPLSFLGGQLPISVTGRLSTKDGQGRFDMQSAEIAGVPVPSAVVEELIAYYARSTDHSSGIRLGETFDLPANIRQIELSRGQMIVVQ